MPLPNSSPFRHLRQQALPLAHPRIITLRLERSLRTSMAPIRRLQMLDFRRRGNPHHQSRSLDFRLIYEHGLPLCLLVPHNLVNSVY